MFHDTTAYVMKGIYVLKCLLQALQMIRSAKKENMNKLNGVMEGNAKSQ